MLSRVSMLASLLLISPILADAGSPGNGKRIYDNRCAKCHHLNGDVKIGPGLKGLFDREGRSVEWVTKFIKSPTRMIQKEKDPIAIKVWEEYDKFVMIIFPPISESEVDDVVAYLQFATKD